MVAKRAVRKLQDTSQTPVKAALDPSAQLASTADDCGAAAARCVHDADSGAVHRVRTSSRRLQAMLEAMLREAPAMVVRQVEEPARAMLRPLKQIRRAAGPVRDLDVHRKLLENWLREGEPKPEDGSESPAQDNDADVLRAQAEKLDTWLKGERKHLAHGMQKQVGKRLQGLQQLRSTLWTAIAQIPPGTQGASREADAVALEDFVRAADAMPLLDAQNLHDFRKATKKARYVAESGAQRQSCSGVAKALKSIQDAIGEWHDWLCLAEEAKTALGQDAPELTTALEREVARHFASAIKTTVNLRGRLLGEWMAMSQTPAKRQPREVAIDSARAVSGI
jgi:CHAD domain-containing protein